MRKFILTNPAREDIKQALRVSLQEHGESAAQRYENLISIALERLCNVQSPEDPFSSSEFEHDPRYRKYHLRLAKVEAAKKGFRVKKPSQIFFYEVTDAEIIVHALIPDMRDFIRHLP